MQARNGGGGGVRGLKRTPGQPQTSANQTQANVKKKRHLTVSIFFVSGGPYGTLFFTFKIHNREVLRYALSVVMTTYLVCPAERDLLRGRNLYQAVLALPTDRSSSDSLA